MVIDSKYTKIFKSQDLTTQKYNELYDFAVFIRNHKNKVSDYINQNLLYYLDMSKFSFMKEIRDSFSSELSSSFYNQIYTDIFTVYQNKFDAIQKKLQFENITFKGFEFYKRNTKNHKKGDFKRVITEKKQTALSNCLTYLARYGNDNTIEYITKQLQSCDANKTEFYNNILRCIEKFGFDRLMRLALSKRTSVIKHYSKKPIEFKSLTFRGRSRKTKILDYNSNYNSIIKTFISLSGFKGRKSLDIPVKFSKDYHGNIKEYFKSNPDYEYLIKFDEYHKNITVYICKDGERYIPEAGDNVVGIDVNCKHNLFSLSNETTYDYDRKLVNDFCRLSIEIDKLKENKDYKIGKRKQHKLDTLKMKMVKSEQQLISRMCKELHNQGFNHIVMEDLDNGFGKCYVKDGDNEDINYNRKDINRYNSIHDLYSLIQTLEGQGVKSQKDVKKEGAEVVYEDSEWKIVIPHTEEASCIYGANTRWCTAGREDNMFEYYNKQGPLYININKVTGEKYQFHFESGSFMDAEDEEISPRKIGLSEGAIEYYKSIGKELYFIYDEVGDFYEGFTWVYRDGKYNFINTNGELVWKGEEWFDNGWSFTNGFANVEIENKGWNWIDTNGELLWKGDEWFDKVYDFSNGFAGVYREGKGYNFINEQGELLWKGNEWFSYIVSFDNGFAEVVYKGDWYKLNTKGELYDDGNRVNIGLQESKSGVIRLRESDIHNLVIKTLQEYLY